MSPDEIREYASTVIFDAVRRIPMIEITDCLDDAGIRWTEADVAEIERRIDTADLAVEWPEIAFAQRASGGDQ